MTHGAASLCVYIGRESQLYKAVRGQVLVTSAYYVPSVICVELCLYLM